MTFQSLYTCWISNQLIRLAEGSVEGIVAVWELALTSARYPHDLNVVSKSVEKFQHFLQLTSSNANGWLEMHCQMIIKQNLKLHTMHGALTYYITYYISHIIYHILHITYYNSWLLEHSPIWNRENSDCLWENSMKTCLVISISSKQNYSWNVFCVSPSVTNRLDFSSAVVIHIPLWKNMICHV